MPQKRKRKRTRLKPAPFLALALLGVLIGGIASSPITSLSRVTIVGAKATDAAAIEQVLGGLKDVPWMAVNTRSVETRVQGIQAVDRASYSQNIFGRARLEVAYRVAVARVRGSRPIGLDGRGVLFQTDALRADLPELVRPESSRNLTAALASGFPGGRIAKLAVASRRMLPQARLTISFNQDGALCLQIDSALVVLGSSDDMDVKLQALKTIMEEQPDLLSKVEKLNLTEPTRPAKTYKKQRQ